jgi:Tfp pilus assembly protein PilV
MKRAAEQGIGLIEVALSLLVISVATLGLVRTQLVAREAAFNALQRGEAVAYMQSLTELLRSNVAAALDYRTGDIEEITPPAADCTTQYCPDSRWGQWNLWQWQQELSGWRVSDVSGLVTDGLFDPQACVRMDQQWVTVEVYWAAPGVAAPRPACDQVAPPKWLRLSLVSRVGEV